MLYRINPRVFIKEHFLTFKDYSSNKICWLEIIVQFGLAAVLAVWHVSHYNIDNPNDIVGIVVSAASIVAGLMLNLMVLIYTLLVSKIDQSKSTSSNIEDFQSLCKETLANIAFSVFVCVVLVISSLFLLGPAGYASTIGQFIMIYSGVILIFTLLIVLKRCYTLISFNISSI